MSSDPALLKKGYPGVEIQPGASIVGNCRIDPSCQIGSQVVIAQEVVVCAGARIYGEVVLERDVNLRENITLVGPLRVGKGAFLAPGVTVGWSRRREYRRVP